MPSIITENITENADMAYKTLMNIVKSHVKYDWSYCQGLIAGTYNGLSLLKFITNKKSDREYINEMTEELFVMAFGAPQK